MNSEECVTLTVPITEEMRETLDYIRALLDDETMTDEEILVMAIDLAISKAEEKEFVEEIEPGGAPHAR